MLYLHSFVGEVCKTTHDVKNLAELGVIESHKNELNTDADN